MISRRTFLKGLLATSVAPAIVRADSLMKIRPREEELIRPFRNMLIQISPNEAPWIVWSDAHPPGTRLDHTWVEEPLNVFDPGDLVLIYRDGVLPI